MAITRLQNKMVFNSFMGLTLITLSFQTRGALAASLHLDQLQINALAPLDGRVFKTTQVLYSVSGSFKATVKFASNENVNFQAGYKLYLDGKEFKGDTQKFSAQGPNDFPIDVEWPPLDDQFFYHPTPVGTHSVKFEIGIFSGEFSPQVVSKTNSFTVVPEPLTILGSGFALGFGAWLQKDFSKKRKKIN